MEFKKVQKSIVYFIGWQALNICSFVVKLIPYRWLFRFAKQMGILGYYIIGKQRKIALESLTFAFGSQKSKKEIRDIAKGCFISIAKSGIELMSFISNKKFIIQNFQLVNKENLDRALSKNKGVILISAHFGNFPLMLARLSVGGYKVGAIMRPMKDSRVEKIFDRERRKVNIKAIYSIPRNTCVAETLQSLRNNEIVFLPLDQNFGTAGVFVDFFGRKAATATGPVIFAQRTNAVMLPVFIVRQPDNTHKIIFDLPVDLVEGKTAEETLVLNVQRITDIIEKYVRKYPSEWGWIHKRWKSQAKK